MAAQEILTGQESKEWVDDLPKLIAAINRKTKKTIPITHSNAPTCQGDSCEMLPLGTKVRVALDQPVNNITKVLHGKFRSGDI